MFPFDHATNGASGITYPEKDTKLDRDARKPVIRIGRLMRDKPACSTTETSYTINNLHVYDKEPLFSNSAVIAGWLQSTRAQKFRYSVPDC